MKAGSMTAAGYLERATELRAVASQMKDLHNRDLMVGAAEEYERMADQLMLQVQSRATPK